MPAMHHTNSRSIYGTFTDIDTSYVADHPRHTQAEDLRGDRSRYRNRSAHCGAAEGLPIWEALCTMQVRPRFHGSHRRAATRVRIRTCVLASIAYAVSPGFVAVLLRLNGYPR
jgi:hypothetical protein